MAMHELDWQGVHAILAVLLMVLVNSGKQATVTGDFVAYLVIFSVDVTVQQQLYDGQWFGPPLKGQVQWKAALKPHTHIHTHQMP